MINRFLILIAILILGTTKTYSISLDNIIIKGNEGLDKQLIISVFDNDIINKPINEIDKDEIIKKIYESIKKGFDRALSTILDANITTLIASLLLFVFGSGPIKGFSITLSLGVIASMFTALMLTNLLVHLYVSFFSKKEINL